MRAEVKAGQAFRPWSGCWVVEVASVTQGCHEIVQAALMRIGTCTLGINSGQAHLAFAQGTCRLASLPLCRDDRRCCCGRPLPDFVFVWVGLYLGLVFTCAALLVFASGVTHFLASRDNQRGCYSSASNRRDVTNNMIDFTTRSIFELRSNASRHALIHALSCASERRGGMLTK